MKKIENARKIDSGVDETCGGIKYGWAVFEIKGKHYRAGYVCSSYKGTVYSNNEASPYETRPEQITLTEVVKKEITTTEGVNA